MDLTQAKDALRTYIREHYNIPMNDPDFNDDTHLFDYGYVDSFGAVDLLNFVENLFQIKLSQSDLVAYPLNTITEIAAFSIQRRGGT
jgi:acyl carrier protein